MQGCIKDILKTTAYKLAVYNVKTVFGKEFVCFPDNWSGGVQYTDIVV